MLLPPDAHLIEHLLAEAAFVDHASDHLFVALNHLTDHLEAFEHDFKSLILVRREHHFDPLLEVPIDLDRTVQAQPELLRPGLDLALPFEHGLERLPHLRGLLLHLRNVGDDEPELVHGPFDAL